MKKARCFMKERLLEKLKELEKYLEELEQNTPETLEEYLASRKHQLICERLFEIILETFVDCLFLFVNAKHMEMPEDDESVIAVLQQKKVLTKELCAKLRDARRMRNIIAHKYGSVNHELVYHAIKEELSRDMNDFVIALRRAL